MGYAVSFLTIAEFLQSYYVIPVAMVIFVTFVMYFFVKQYLLSPDIYKGGHTRQLKA